MSTETTINQMIFNQLSETKYNQIVPEEGQFYITPDYTDLPILTHHWFDHIVNDIQWLRADTFSWQSGDVYTTAYNHLVNDINNAPIQADTINGITINYWLASDGHKIVGTVGGDVYEQNIIDLYNQTGVAWYYLLDTTNHRFKLPRTKFGFTGLRDSVGNYVAPGLPNITGNVGQGYNGTALNGGWHNYQNGGFGQGALYLDGTNNGSSCSWSNYNDAGKIAFDASRSNPIYGASTTVQPPATQMYLYFFVGNFTKSAIEQTAGITSELVNQCKAALEEFNNIKTPNYYFYRWEGLSSVSSVQEHGVSFTNKRGNPIYISISGDNNPLSDTAWLGISIYRDGVRLGYQIAESHGVSWNIPFCLNYMDTNVIKGTTYGYTIKLYDGGNGTINLQESDTSQAPKISIFEL